MTTKEFTNQLEFTNDGRLSFFFLGTGNAFQKTYYQSNILVGFNNKYMIDALRVCDTDEVKIILNGPVSPILVVPPEGENFIFLILPMRLKNEG